MLPTLLKLKKEMRKITIEVRDDAPIGGKALEGTVKLTSETTGVFTEWKRSVRTRTQKERVYKKLIHGSISASEDDVRLTLCIDRHETRVDDETLTQVLEFDCSEACSVTEVWEEDGGVLSEDKSRRVNPLNL